LCAISPIPKFPASIHLTKFYHYQQRGFAFIDYENTGDAEKAKESMLDKDMGGQKINIGKYIN
tara:strand:+ start:270 stop:458 length:189 start_codon:yes stop_codon:yes gene_type:complete